MLRWVLPLHFGTFGGRATKLLYVAASLSPVLLAVTGLVLWRNRKRKQRAPLGPRGGRLVDSREARIPISSGRET